MNSPHVTPISLSSSELTRREAIKRTALLLGVAVSPSLLTGVMRAQAAPASNQPPKSYLTAAQRDTAGAIAERILPKSETPGARDVGVPAFIDLMYGEYMTAAEQSQLVAGLAEIDSMATAEHRQSFARLQPEQQDALLKRLAAASQSKKDTFFHQICELTLLGYFTSEPIGRHVLHYDPVPGRYDGCIPLSEVGNVSWTK